MNKEDYIEIGHIGKPHGYKGQMNFAITCEDEVQFDKINFVLLEINNLLTPFFVEKIDHNHKALIKLENIHTDKEAKAFQSKKVFIQKEFVTVTEAEEGLELEGYEVIDHLKGVLGKVIRIEEMPANDMLIIMHNEKELLLPINDEFIEEINETTKCIKYKAPEGLIDLYLE